MMIALDLFQHKIVQCLDCFHCKNLGRFTSRNTVEILDLIHHEMIKISLNEKGPKFGPFCDENFGLFHHKMVKNVNLIHREMVNKLTLFISKYGHNFGPYSS